MSKILSSGEEFRKKTIEGVSLLSDYVGATLGGGFLAGMFQKMFHERAIASAQNAKDSEYENMVNS